MDGLLWAEHDFAVCVKTERMTHELRDSLIGRRFWTVLETAARNALPNTKAVFCA